MAVADRLCALPACLGGSDGMGKWIFGQSVCRIQCKHTHMVVAKSFGQTHKRYDLNWNYLI